MPPVEDGDEIEIELPWMKDGHELIGEMLRKWFAHRKSLRH